MKSTSPTPCRTTQSEPTTALTPCASAVRVHDVKETRQAVDVALLESPLILRLVEKVRGLGFPAEDVNEWIPVYGTIWGVFNVKREMKPLELGKLKQSIYLLEKDIEGGAAGLRPRLINRYFWLVDHYLTAREPRQRIEEVLGRIKELDPQVHREYAT